ncbi:hypothetical protein GKZ27_11450 [Enterorhabdus mucosicola]|uniref:Uncharacterized protein n=1 Tax=Adlercreutzia mucosicola TaxID=580026 RepID=A0A6N8JSC2_9ACTN|nr:hypothetical protein [Adlercreutzia mucosicola]
MPPTPPPPLPRAARPPRPPRQRRLPRRVRLPCRPWPLCQARSLPHRFPRRPPRCGVRPCAAGPKARSRWRDSARAPGGSRPGR